MMIDLLPQWMHWTMPTLFFVGAILLMLVVLSFWDARDPGWARQGVLPIETSRGDRVFMSILTTGILFCLWLYFVGTTAIWGVLVAGAAAATGIMNLF